MRALLPTDISKVLYHGTSEDRWRKIRRQGIKPNPGPFGRGAYMSETTEMPHFYASHGDDEEIIRRYHGDRADELVRPRGGQGRVLFVDETGHKRPEVANPFEHPTRRPQSIHRREYVVPEGIPPERIFHSQRASMKSHRRWLNRSDTQDAEALENIRRSQAKRKGVIAANKARHPKGAVPGPKVTVKTRNRTARRAAAAFHEELGNAGAKRLVRRRAAQSAGAGTAAVGAAAAGLAARAGARKKALAAAASKRSRNLKLAAMGTIAAGGAGGLALNKADDVIVPRAVEHAIRRQHAPEHHEAKMEEARGYYRQLRDARRQELADLRKPDPSGPQPIKPTPAQAVKIEQHRSTKKRWAAIKRKKRKKLVYPPNRYPSEMTGSEVGKSLPSALRGKTPAQATSIYARDRIMAQEAGKRAAALIKQRGAGNKIGAATRRGKELRARSRRFIEMDAAGIPAERVTTPARVRAPQSPMRWEPDTRISLNQNKYDKAGRARDEANRAINRAHLVEAEQRIVDAWKKDIGKAWGRKDYPVVVTGSRDISPKDRKRIRRDLSRTKLVRPHRKLIVHHGGASGADEAAGEWAWDKKVDQEWHPADWGRHGRAAGPIRNKRMLQHAQPKKVLAYPKGESKGTRNAIAEAQKQGYKVKVRELKKSEEMLRAQAASRVANAKWAHKHPDWVERHKEISAIPVEERRLAHSRGNRTPVSQEKVKQLNNVPPPEKRHGLRRLMPKRRKKLVAKSDEISKWKGYAVNRARKRYNRLRRRRY